MIATKFETALRAMGFGTGDPANEKIGWLGAHPEPPKDHFSCELCGQHHLDCTLIEHKPSCPILLAREAFDAN